MLFFLLPFDWKRSFLLKRGKDFRILRYSDNRMVGKSDFRISSLIVGNWFNSKVESPMAVVRIPMALF